MTVTGARARPRRERVQAALVGTAAASYAASCTLGALVGLRAVDSSAFRWLHGALYAATAATALAAASSALWGRSRPGAALLPALAAWAVLPRVGAPSPRHTALGLAPSPAYALALHALRRA